MENQSTENYFVKEEILSQFGILLVGSSCTCHQSNVDCGCTAANVASSSKCTEYHHKYDETRSQSNA